MADINRREFLMQSCCFAAAPALGAQNSGDRLAPVVRSWEQVPVYRHLGPSSLTSAEVDRLGQLARFLTIERVDPIGKHNQGDQVDTAYFEVARALKTRNPGMILLMYWNTFINRSPSVKGYDPAWNLKDKQGADIIMFGRFSRPDLSLPEVREWWSEVVADSLRNAPFDGIFADALPQVLSPALPRLVGEGKARQVVEGLELMLKLTRQKLGPDKFILANGLRGSDFRALLDWDSISGLYIEHFGYFGCTSAEAIRADLDSLKLAERKGKFCVLKAWPGFSWLDPAFSQLSPQDLITTARERITFPLACFLVSAGEGSCFSYSWGYLKEYGMLESYPEFSKPLGQPKGDGVSQGKVATREFAHASVTVDLANQSARIQWQ